MKHSWGHKIPSGSRGVELGSPEYVLVLKQSVSINELQRKVDFRRPTDRRQLSSPAAVGNRQRLETITSRSMISLPIVA